MVHTDEKEPKWVLEHKKTERSVAAMREKQDLEVRLAKVRAKELRQKQRFENGESNQKRMVCVLCLPLDKLLTLRLETRSG